MAKDEKDLAAIQKSLDEIREALKRTPQSDLDRKLVREQIKAIRSQQRGDKADKMVQIFRGTVERMSPKPISRKRNHELFFGTDSLKSMFGKKE